MSHTEDKDINHIVLTAAQNIAVYQYNLDGVCRKARTHRRNRYVAAGVAVALAITAAIAVPTMLKRASPDTPPATPPLVHRVVVSGSSLKFPPGYERTPEETFETAPSGTIGVWYNRGELLGDGTLKTFPEVPGGVVGDVGSTMVLTENGGYVFRVLHHLTPPTIEGENGQRCPNSERELVVLNSAGAETLRRKLADTKCEPSQLVGADSAYAYLTRAGKLLRHKLSDGTESDVLDIVVPHKSTDGPARIIGSYDSVSIFGRFAVISFHHVDMATDPLQDSPVRVVNLDTGATTEGSFAFKADWIAAPVDLSPDGQWLAFRRIMSADTVVPKGPIGLFVANVRTGEIRQLREFPENGSTGYAGMGWATDNTLRVAWFDIPSDRLVRLSEVLHTTDYPL